MSADSEKLGARFVGLTPPELQNRTTETPRTQKTIHLFVAGVGRVGSTLLAQLAAQGEHFKARNVYFKLAGVAKTDLMYVNADGIPPESCKDALAQGEHAKFASFVKAIQDFKLPNSVFIDCTSSEEVAASYQSLIKSGVSIVTPNKKCNSANFKQYEAVKRAAKRSKVKYYYETTVGAGLPVIGTLHDLIASGDTIYKIESVLSGTLSFLFNNFDGTKPFSELLREAHALGYTEPDPRDDLSGMDVARKLLILAREMGATLELEDITVESLVPAVCEQVETVEELFRVFPQADEFFAERLKEAREQGRVLRYVGSIEPSGARLGLQQVPLSHPFYALSGSDNIISFTTQRYRERPLVVKGPGAGTEVTAAGVLADLLRVASYLS